MSNKIERHRGVQGNKIQLAQLCVKKLGRLAHFFNLSIILHNRNWARPTSHLQRGLAGSPGGCCWGWTGLAESPRSSEEPSAPSPLLQLALHLQGNNVECFFLGWNSETSTNHGLVGIWGWSRRWTLGADLVVALPVLKAEFWNIISCEKHNLSYPLRTCIFVANYLRPVRQVPLI